MSVESTQSKGRTPSVGSGELVSWLTGRTRKKARREAAELVRAAFDGTDWSTQVFVVGGVEMSTKSGETKFYEAREIDAAIARLNKVLRELRS